jgi:hypothetical protein
LMLIVPARSYQPLDRELQAFGLSRSWRQADAPSTS